MTLERLEGCISQERDDEITAEEEAKTDVIVLQEIVVSLQNQIFKLKDRISAIEDCAGSALERGEEATIQAEVERILGLTDEEVLAEAGPEGIAQALALRGKILGWIETHLPKAAKS